MLVLSEFAGAAQVLGDYSMRSRRIFLAISAIIPCNLGDYSMRSRRLFYAISAMTRQALGAGCLRVNPYDTQELAETIHVALSMGDERRAELHTYASAYVRKFTAQARPP